MQCNSILKKGHYMNVEVNMKIGYDDLSDECKEKIKELEKMTGSKLTIIYPELVPTVKSKPSYANMPFDSWHDRLGSHAVLCNATKQTKASKHIDANEESECSEYYG